jgi:hypothetical protein
MCGGKVCGARAIALVYLSIYFIKGPREVGLFSSMNLARASLPAFVPKMMLGESVGDACVGGGLGRLENAGSGR